MSEIIGANAHSGSGAKRQMAVFEQAYEQLLSCYNCYIVDKQYLIACFLRTTMGLMLVIGFLPIFHILPTQTGHMQGSAQSNMQSARAISENQNMPTPCCSDSFGSPSSICSLAILTSTTAIHSAAIQQVAFSPLFIQHTFPEIATPPPRI